MTKDNELAALKAQSTEPFAWASKYAVQLKESGAIGAEVSFVNLGWTDQIELFTTPPQAEALVADELSRLQRENEELRKAEILLAVRTEELAALKSQASEPVAWRVQWQTGDEAGEYWVTTDTPSDTMMPHANPLYLAPPQAEAFVADFKRRVLEVVRPSPTLKVSKALRPMKEQGDGVREVLADIIESLPLIKGEK